MKNKILITFSMIVISFCVWNIYEIFFGSRAEWGWGQEKYNVSLPTIPGEKNIGAQTAPTLVWSSYSGQTYANEKYGFKISLPQYWNGVKLATQLDDFWSTENDNGNLTFFLKPLASNSVSLDDDLNIMIIAFARPFGDKYEVRPTNVQEWPGEFLAKNNDYVFLWSYASPVDQSKQKYSAQEYYNQAENIVKTFELRN